MRRTDIRQLANCQRPERSRPKLARSFIFQITTVQAEVLGGIEDLLESLPLATTDHDLATARIRTARRYYSAGETGAATYELRLLCGQPGIPGPGSASDFQIGDSGTTEHQGSDAGTGSLVSTAWRVVRQVPRLLVCLPLVVFLPVYVLAWFAYWAHPEEEEPGDTMSCEED